MEIIEGDAPKAVISELLIKLHLYSLDKHYVLHIKDLGELAGQNDSDLIKNYLNKILDFKTYEISRWLFETLACAFRIAEVEDRLSVSLLYLRLGEWNSFQNLLKDKVVKVPVEDFLGKKVEGREFCQIESIPVLFDVSIFDAKEVKETIDFFRHQDAHPIPTGRYPEFALLNSIKYFLKRDSKKDFDLMFKYPQRTEYAKLLSDQIISSFRMSKFSSSENIIKKYFGIPNCCHDIKIPIVDQLD